MCNELITKQFEGQEINFKINDNGLSFVQIDKVAKFCGWTRIANSGNEVVRWSTVNKFLKELSCQQVGTGDFIPEYVMYALIGKAKNDKATGFMLWVGQVLTDLRTKGIVILDYAEDNAIEFEKKFGKYRIRKTFTNSKNITEDYKQFVELSKIEWKAKRLDNVERVKLCNIIVNSLENKINGNILELKASEIICMQEIISEIKTDITKLSNKKNGGEKGVQTKIIGELENKIIKLQEKINELDPSLEEMFCIHTHPFTWNNAIENGHRTIAYNNWINNFPVDDVPSQEVLEMDYGVDFTKPIKIFLRYINKNKFDMSNLSKSFIDRLFNEYRGVYEIDDKIIHSLDEKTIEHCNCYQDGKVYFYIKNMDDAEIKNIDCNESYFLA